MTMTHFGARCVSSGATVPLLAPSCISRHMGVWSAGVLRGPAHLPTPCSRALARLHAFCYVQPMRLHTALFSTLLLVHLCCSSSMQLHRPLPFVNRIAFPQTPACHRLHLSPSHNSGQYLRDLPHQVHIKHSPCAHLSSCTAPTCRDTRTRTRARTRTRTDTRARTPTPTRTSTHPSLTPTPTTTHPHASTPTHPHL